MGAYLSEPDTDKISKDEKLDDISYGSSSMQGWRISQEDAHVCKTDFDPDSNTLMFAVFDGHGGSEVAKYCADHFSSCLLGVEAYRNGELGKALEEAFIAFDGKLLEDDVMDKLKEMAGFTKEEGDDQADEDDEDLGALTEEAVIPLEDLVAKYGALAKDDSPLSQLTRFLSPIIKAKQAKRLSEEADAEAEGGGSTSKSDETLESEITPLATSSQKTDECDDTPSSSSQKSEGNGSAGDGSKAETSKPGGEAAAEVASKPKEAEDDAAAIGPSTSQQESSSGEKGKGEGADDEEEDDEYKAIEEEESSSDDEEDSDEEEGNEEGEDAPNMDLMDGDLPGMDSGTTAVVALLRGTELLVGNAGDSRCVVSRRGEAIDMSVDHKPDDQREMERIIKAGGHVTEDGRVNGGLNLSRAIGDHTYKKNSELALADQMITAQPDIRTLSLEDGDEFMVIACDGIWNSMSSQEAVDFVRTRLQRPADSRPSPSSICEQIFEACLAPDTSGDGTGCDNMTCIIVTFDKLCADYGASTAAEAVPSEIQELKRKLPTEAINGPAAMVPDSTTGKRPLENGENGHVTPADTEPAAKKVKQSV